MKVVLANPEKNYSLDSMGIEQPTRSEKRGHYSYLIDAKGEDIAFDTCFDNINLLCDIVNQQPINDVSGTLKRMNFRLPLVASRSAVYSHVQEPNGKVLVSMCVNIRMDGRAILFKELVNAAFPL